MNKLIVCGLALLWLTGCSGPPEDNDPTTYSSGQFFTASPQPEAPKTAEEANERLEQKLAAGDFVRVKEQADRYLEQWPGDWRLLTQRGDAQQAMGRVKEAEADFTAALKEAPPDARWRVLESRAIVGMQMGNHAQAEKDFQASLKAAGAEAPPDYLKTFYQLRGRNFLEWGKFKEAIPQFDQALKLNPSDHEALGMRALCFYRLKDKKRYKTDLEELRKLSRATAESLEHQVSQGEATPADRQVLEGTGYFNAGNNELALARFNRALELDPKKAEAWLRKGAVLARMGRLDQAVEAYTKCWEMAHQEAALFARAGCYQKMGQKDKAKADFQKYLEVGTDRRSLDMARQALAELESK